VPIPTADLSGGSDAFLPVDDVIMSAADAEAAARPTSPPERVRELAHVPSFHVRCARAKGWRGSRGRRFVRWMPR